MAGKSTAIGLDIGRHSVKAVWLERRTGQRTITRCEVLRLPADAADLKPVVGPWLEKNGLLKQDCVVGLPGSQTTFQPFTLSPQDPRTVDQAATMEVIRFNDMTSETMVYDFAPFALAEGERRLLIAMARPTLLEERLAAIRALDIVTLNVVPTPVALFNALEDRLASNDPPVMYVNVGHSSTDVAIGSPRGLMFARSFGGGGQMFTDAIARTAKIPAGQAENIKVARADFAGGDETFAPVLTASADMWLTEVRSCMSLYRSLFPAKECQPPRIVMAGGGSLLRGFTDYVAQRLDLPVSLARGTTPAPDAESMATFAVAIGLAESAFGPCRSDISLLPDHLRDELTFRRQKPYWIAAAVVAALTLGVSLAAGYRDNKIAERSLKSRMQSLDQRQNIVAQIETVKARNARILDMGGQLKNLLATGPVMRDLIALVSESKASSDWITMVCDADSYFSNAAPNRVAVRRPSAPPVATAATVRPLQGVIVAGYTRNSSLATIKTLIERLKAADFVESADLLSDDMLVEDPRFKNTWESPYAQRFVINVRLKNP